VVKSGQDAGSMPCSSRKGRPGVESPACRHAVCARPTSAGRWSARSISTWRPARWSACWGRMAPARPRRLHGGRPGAPRCRTGAPRRPGPHPGADASAGPPGISYLAQEPSVFRRLTVEQNLLAILETVERQPALREQRKERLLEEFRLQHVARSFGYALSGGERRRTEIGPGAGAGAALHAAR